MHLYEPLQANARLVLENGEMKSKFKTLPYPPLDMIFILADPVQPIYVLSAPRCSR